MIHRLAEKIKAGTKFFVNHGKETNSHKNRESVGEVIASYTTHIEGRLSNVVIGHFPEKEPVSEMDVCSIEAEIYTDEENIVGDVDEVSGVALGNSQQDHPAFPGALRLGAVQCFDSGEEDEDMAKEKLTFSEVKQAVSEMNIHPRQLFSVDDLKDDREFGKHFDETTTLKVENERLSKELKDTKAEGQASVKKAEDATANTRLDERLKEGFTDLQKSFIKKQFDPGRMESVSEEALDTFVEQSKKDFAETAKLFNVVEKNSSSSTDNDDKNKKNEDGNSDGATEDELEVALKEMGVGNG